MTKQEDTAHCFLQDPDPLSIVLTTLGAVGSVASLVAMAQQKRRDREIDERLDRQDRSELIEHLAAAEAALADLSSVISKVRIIAQLSGTQALREYIDLPQPNGSLAFGEHGFMLDSRALDQFFNLQDHAFRSARGAQKSLALAFRVLYRTQSGIPNESFQQLVGVIRDVNSLLAKHISVDDLLVRAEKVTNDATTTIHSLRIFMSPGPDSTPSDKPRFG